MITSQIEAYVEAVYKLHVLELNSSVHSHSYVLNHPKEKEQERTEKNNEERRKKNKKDRKNNKNEQEKNKKGRKDQREIKTQKK